MNSQITEEQELSYIIQIPIQHIQQRINLHEQTLNERTLIHQTLITTISTIHSNLENKLNKHPSEQKEAIALVLLEIQETLKFLKDTHKLKEKIIQDQETLALETYKNQLLTIT